MQKPHPDFFLPIEKVSLTEFMPKHAFSSKLSHLVITHTKEGPKVVNACSKNYTIITNEDIFKPLEQHLGDSFELEIKANQMGYSKFYMDFMLKDKALAVIKKDMIIPTIRVMNSYDGSLKFSFTLMFTRLVCTNGLTVPLRDARNAHIKMMHTPSAIGKWDKVVQIAEDFLAKSKEMLGGYKELASHTLNLDDALLRLEDVVKNTKAPSKAKERMAERMIKEHKEDGLPYSDWLVYNAVNYELNHGESRAPLHKKAKVDQQVLAYLLPGTK